MELPAVLVLIHALFSLRGSESYELLDKHLLYYEPLLYDSEDLHHQHSHVTHPEDRIHLNFQAFNKTFKLELKRTTVSSSIELHHKQKSTTADLSFIYEGKHSGYADSRVRVAIVNGTLQGKIVLPGDSVYHIAPSGWLFHGSPPFHTVIYSEKDYLWNPIFLSEARDVEWKIKTDIGVQSKGRFKRDVPQPETTDRLLKNNVCTLKLTTDHTVWRYFMGRNQNQDRSYYDILYLLASHVAEANLIFGQTEFTLNSGRADERKIKGLQFAIKTIKMRTGDDCKNAPKDEKGICNQALDGESLLKTFTETDAYGDSDSEDYDYHVDYGNENGDIGMHCLSFLVTARVLYFAAGSPPKSHPLLGLAYPARPNVAGGICSDYANTGFITLLQGTDRHEKLPPHKTELVFTHELAHAFGAVHDDQKECSDFNLREEPDDGFFIMHSIAQRGDKPNHFKFSPCSKDFMARTLLHEKYSKCFIEEKTLPFCGNGIMDTGEECDCGEDCHFDRCCYPHNSSNALRCTLKSGSQCSLSHGPCCNGETCQYINKTDHFKCQNEQPCMSELFCDGEVYGAKCPPPEKDQLKPDGFICSSNGRACNSGNCNASVCQLINWIECQVFLDKKTLTIEEKEKLCYIGCQKSGSTECVSSNDLTKVHMYPEFEALLKNISEHEKTFQLPIQLPIGTTCNKNRGYCDVFRRCRGADPDTPLAKLHECLTSGECFLQVVSFVKVYWWLVLITTLVAITFFYLFVKCCAVHTKSSNPNFELRHPHRSVRQSVSSVGQSIRHPQRSFRHSINGLRESFRRRSDRHSREISVSKMIPEIEKLNEQQNKELDDVFL